MFSITGFVSFRNCHLIQNVTLSGTHSILLATSTPGIEVAGFSKRISTQKENDFENQFKQICPYNHPLLEWNIFQRFPQPLSQVVNDRKGLWQSKPGLTGASCGRNCGRISAARGYRKAWAALNYGPYARSLNLSQTTVTIRDFCHYIQ